MLRTDLAIEINETLAEKNEGITEEKENFGDVEVSVISVKNEKGEKAIKKPIGEYITVEFPPVEKITDYGNLKSALKRALNLLLPEIPEKVLVVGLGNTDITPDSIGPSAVAKILATRHIVGQFAESVGLKGLKSVAVISPGVLGKTGIEVMELTAGTVERIKPDAIIVIDALASASIKRLFRTVQFCNTGISPGSGVKNSRKELSLKTLGVPVIAIGVPTVVDASTVAFELTGKEPEEDVGMIVTSKEADLLCNRVSEIISEVLNVFLQPELDESIILSLV